MNSKCVRVGLLRTNCYIVEDNSGSEPFLAVIDPGDDPGAILGALPGTPTHIIITHCHFDHVGALEVLHEQFPLAEIAVGEHEEMDPERIAMEGRSVLGSFFSRTGLYRSGSMLPEPTMLLKDGDRIGPFQVLHTPGHTKGSICLYRRDPDILYSGDTLFRHAYGRTDLAGGSDSDMAASIKRLLSLEPDTTVYPGHDASTTLIDEIEFYS